jgi:uncharacterized coiled-coil protein SlyX
MANEPQGDRIKELEKQIAEKEQLIKDLRMDAAALTVEINESQGKFEKQISSIAAQQEQMNKSRDEKIETLENKIKELETLLDEKTVIKEFQTKVKM